MKWDPRADGRVAQQGDLVAVFIEWDCPQPASPVYLVRGQRVDATGQGLTWDETTRTSWTQVRNFFQTNYGVTLPASPSCPGYEV